jgi:hypothetical protein
MTTTYFPNGQSLISSALSITVLNSLLQGLIAQMIGVIIPTAPLLIAGDITAGSSTVVNVAQGGAYQGCIIAGAGIPLGNGISAVGTGTIQILAPATVTATQVSFSVYDPNAWQKCRIAWQQRGQPGFSFGSDVVTIRVTEVEVEYNKTRNLTDTANDGFSITQTFTYQRTWRCFLSLYGPNGFDNARIIKSALFLDWSRDTLAVQNLYCLPDFARTVRVPELVDGQWAEMSSWEFQMNEGITEVITTPTVASVDVQTFIGANDQSVEIFDQTFSV